MTTKVNNFVEQFKYYRMNTDFILGMVLLVLSIVLMLVANHVRDDKAQLADATTRIAAGTNKKDVRYKWQIRYSMRFWSGALAFLSTQILWGGMKGFFGLLVAILLMIAMSYLRKKLERC